VAGVALAPRVPLSRSWRLSATTCEWDGHNKPAHAALGDGHDSGVSVSGAAPRAQGGRCGGGRVVAEDPEEDVYERTPTIFTRLLRNRYGTFMISLVLPGILSGVSPQTQLVIGLANALLRAMLASPFPHEDLSSCYYGNKRRHALATPYRSSVSSYACAYRKQWSGRQACVRGEKAQDGPASHCPLYGCAALPRCRPRLLGLLSRAPVPRGPRLWASVALTEGKEDAHRLPREACLERATWRVCRDYRGRDQPSAPSDAAADTGEARAAGCLGLCWSLVERAALVSRALACPHRSRLPRCSHRGGHALMGQPRSWRLIPKHRDTDTAHK